MKAIHIICIALLFQGCTLFEKDETLLAEYRKSTGTKIRIYSVGLGATTSDVIQVRKAGQQKPLWVSDKFNYLKNSSLTNDTTLMMILSYTGYHSDKDKLDTIVVDIK